MEDYNNCTFLVDYCKVQPYLPKGSPVHSADTARQN